MAMTAEERKAYFDEHGFYPVEDSDIPEDEKLTLTPAQLNLASQMQEKMNAISYLNETDWYVARKIETGKEIPTDITEKRAQARIDADYEA